MDAIRRDYEASTPRERRAVIMLAAIAVCAVVIGGGWLTPVAHQEFRNQVMAAQYGRPSVAWRDIRGRTTLDLIAGEGSTIPEPTRTRELASRVTLAMLPAVLAWLRWRSLSRVRTRSWPQVKSCLLGIAAFVAYGTLLPVSIGLEQAYHLTPGIGPLLALGVFALTARTGIWLRQRATS